MEDSYREEGSSSALGPKNIDEIQFDESSEHEFRSRADSNWAHSALS